jgi:hypothetical protein
MPRSRTIKTLSALLGAMTVGSFVLLALETSPARTGAEVPSLTARSAGETLEFDHGIITDTKIPVQPAKWSSIVIHDGVCDAKGNPVGGSHFIVYGAGAAVPEGTVRATSRWQEQADGAHVFLAGQNLNSSSIGVCLAGDLSVAALTPRQMNALAALVQDLQRQLGIGAERVYLHSDLTGGHCPGDFFPVDEFRSRLLPNGR